MKYWKVVHQGSVRIFLERNRQDMRELRSLMRLNPFAKFTLVVVV